MRPQGSVHQPVQITAIFATVSAGDWLKMGIELLGYQPPFRFHVSVRTLLSVHRNALLKPVEVAAILAGVPADDWLKILVEFFGSLPPVMFYVAVHKRKIASLVMPVSR